MKTASVQEVPQRWTAILEWVTAGEEVQMMSEGQPVARLTPWSERRPFIGATAGGPALPANLDETTGEKW
jgi:antitoxin (DNA-binding transcriptional repressor) of toxin-antitoxin stability system